MNERGTRKVRAITTTYRCQHSFHYIPKGPVSQKPSVSSKSNHRNCTVSTFALEMGVNYPFAAKSPVANGDVCVGLPFIPAVLSRTILSLTMYVISNDVFEYQEQITCNMPCFWQRTSAAKKQVIEYQKPAVSQCFSYWGRVS
jgi:hypothetical protein